jgi:hypothetical protein
MYISFLKIELYQKNYGMHNILLQTLHPFSVVVICGCIFLFIAIMIINIMGLIAGKEKLFMGSGVPGLMAKAINNLSLLNSQFLYGSLITSLVLIGITEKIIESNVGIPIITSIIGFLIGKNQNTERSYGDDKKNEHS